MGFWKKEDESKIPEKLRNMTPEQLVEAIEKAEKLEKDTTALQAALAEKDTKIAMHSTELETMRSQIQSLEANRKKEEKKPLEDNSIELADDPEAFIRQEINRSSGPLAAGVLQTNSQLARMGAKQTLDRLRIPGTKISKGAMFDKYITDIEKMAKATDVRSLQTPDAWIYLFNMVVGSHMDEILGAEREGKGDSLFIEPSASSAALPDEKKPDKVTDEEARIAARMKISVEQYMKQKKEMTFA